MQLCSTKENAHDKVVHEIGTKYCIYFDIFIKKIHGEKVLEKFILKY